jgi:hypothetical protein
MRIHEKIPDKVIVVIFIGSCFDYSVQKLEISLLKASAGP